jgi:hypothetical protein
MDPMSLLTSPAGRMRALAERAARGAALLDQRWPGWADAIDPRRLDLASAEDDVLGQLYGSFDEGLGELVMLDANPGAWADSDWAPTYGFDLPAEIGSDQEPAGYADLIRCWRSEIARRQHPGRAVQPMTETAALRQLAEVINRRYQRVRYQHGETKISAAPVDVAGVPGVNLFDHSGSGRPRPVDTVWHVAAGEPLPGSDGRRAAAGCFVWGPSYNWSAPTADVEAAADQVLGRAGRWPDQPSTTTETQAEGGRC